MARGKNYYTTPDVNGSLRVHNLNFYARFVQKRYALKFLNQIIYRPFLSRDLNKILIIIVYT